MKKIDEITPEIKYKLSLIYKEFEGQHKDRKRGASGNIKVPDFKCQEYFEDGVRKLTEWEKRKLSEYDRKEERHER